MSSTPIIDHLKVLKNNFESTSESERPKAWKSTSEKNDNPVSRHYELLTDGKRSMRGAIDAMYGCIAKEQGYREEDWIEPEFRKLIRNCNSPGCPSQGFWPCQGETHD